VGFIPTKQEITVSTIINHKYKRSYTDYFKALRVNGRPTALIDYTVGFRISEFPDLQPQRFKMACTIFFLKNSKKFARFHSKIPKSQIDPQIPKILGKIPSSGSITVKVRQRTKSDDAREE
jgi:hypothetical protein